MQDYRWGIDDCVLAAGDLSEILTGIDSIADLRGRWSSKAEAYRVIASLGHGLPEAMHHYLTARGFREVKPDDATIGAWGVVENDGVATAACKVETGWFMRMDRGFRIAAAVDRAWARSK